VSQKSATEILQAASEALSLLSFVAVGSGSAGRKFCRFAVR
jgi:hypothetical protein